MKYKVQGQDRLQQTLSEDTETKRRGEFRSNISSEEYEYRV